MAVSTVAAQLQSRPSSGNIFMRTLFGWGIKLAFVGLIYAGVSGAIPLTLPDTIFGYQVPDAAKRFAGAGGQLQEIADKTQTGFKGIADSLK
jgi:hypothetical protein